VDVASLLTLLLLAGALAAQPWSVLASVLLVTSDRGVAKVVAYAAGWAGALLVVAAVTFAAHPDGSRSASTSPLLSWVELGAGVALSAYLVVRLRRPRRPAQTKQPRWMDRLNSMSLPAAFVLGAFLPNYVIVVAAVNEMLEADLTPGGLAFAAVAFVLVSSLGVGAPLLVLAFRRGDAEPVYRSWRTWLTAHGETVVMVVLTMVVVVLLAKGAVGLLA
jgi:hypothetical protein